MASEEREISSVGRVIIRNWGELLIEQGDTERLTVEAEDEFLDKVVTSCEGDTLQLQVGRRWSEMVRNAFQTGLSRQNVKYHLTIRELSELEVPAAARVRIGALRCENLRILFAGAGTIDIDDLNADYLEIEMPGAGRLTVSGHVEEQKVIMSGAGAYSADKLECLRADVLIRGVGKSTVRVNEALNATLQGLGAIEYYGDPVVDKQIKGLGGVTRLGE